MTLHMASDRKREKNTNKLQNNSLPFINRKRAVFCATDILKNAIIMQLLHFLQQSIFYDDSASCEEYKCVSSRFFVFMVNSLLMFDFQFLYRDRTLFYSNIVHSLYGQMYWDTNFFRRKKGTSKLWQQRWEHNVLKHFISTSVATALKCMKWLYPYVIGVWWWIFGSMSAFKVTPEVFSWD